jgi:hypothetical protein
MNKKIKVTSGHKRKTENTKKGAKKKEWTRVDDKECLFIQK